MGYRTSTRPGRLALLDQTMLVLEASLLSRMDGRWAQAPVVDVGIGAQPWTTAELAACVAPLRFIGVDRSSEVLETARSFEGPGLRAGEGQRIVALPQLDSVW